MIHNKRTTLRKKRGFTLVEIMVVVIVLGVLAALVIPNLIGKTDEARVSSAKSDVSGMTTMIEAFRLDMRRYPTEEEGLGVLREPPSSEDANLWKGPYSKKPISNDPWGHPYLYHSPAPDGVSEMGIESLGADGQPGGEGYAKDINSWSNYDDKTEGEAKPAGQ